MFFHHPLESPPVLGRAHHMSVSNGRLWLRRSHRDGALKVKIPTHERQRRGGPTNRLEIGRPLCRRTAGEYQSTSQSKEQKHDGLEGGEEGKSLEEKRRLKGGEGVEGGEETEWETVAYYLTTTVPDHWLSNPVYSVFSDQQSLELNDWDTHGLNSPASEDGEKWWKWRAGAEERRKGSRLQSAIDLPLSKKAIGQSGTALSPTSKRPEGGDEEARRRRRGGPVSGSNRRDA
ncbi:hypothetical protein EYF80_031579 [Liparis tanakae]|uniref:Uncharacterized protein n=1 Tax=Liparis tanakae TaxID=230148 RepID=A0A4Z2GXN8_9TELE|nr:hypothetical protein EYF80_031579 [Liparis tanakae]